MTNNKNGDITMWWENGLAELESETPGVLFERTVDDLIDGIIDFGISEGHITDDGDLHDWIAPIGSWIVDRRKAIDGTDPDEVSVMADVINDFGDDELEKELAFAEGFGAYDEQSRQWLELLKAENRNRSGVVDEASSLEGV